MADRYVRDLARAVRVHAGQMAHAAVRAPRYATVTATDPLTVEVTDADLLLDEGDDLVLGQAVRQYDADTGLDVGDTLSVVIMPDGDWLAQDVIADVEITAQSTTGPAGGVLSGTYPNPGFAVDMATQAELDAGLLAKAPLASPALTGTPTAPTAATATNTTQIATTAYVKAQGYAVTGAAIPESQVTNLTTDLAAKAPLASPALTGTPTVPTAAVDTNTTQAASTAFVLAQAASATPLVDGAAAVGTSTRFARGDHVHPTDTSRAALASPTFTGTPAGPTAAVDTNTTQVATTAFVLAQAASATPLIDGAAAVGTSTRFARADHVHPTDTTRASLASPTLTGTPAAPTAAVDTNTTQVATTAFVLAQAASATPLIDGTATVGTSTRFARGDHVHPTDTSRAALASPTFTGTPAAPTPAGTTSTTQIATTAFVAGNFAGAPAATRVLGGFVTGTTGALSNTTGGVTASRGSVGGYTLTWSTTYGTAPAVSLTLTQTGFATVTAISTTSASITTRDTAGSGADRDFHFTVIGLK